MTAGSLSNGSPSCTKPPPVVDCGFASAATRGKNPSSTSARTSAAARSTETVPPISFRPRPSTATGARSGAPGSSGDRPSSVSLAIRQACHRATDCHGSGVTPFSCSNPAA